IGAGLEVKLDTSGAAGPVAGIGAFPFPGERPGISDDWYRSAVIGAGAGEQECREQRRGEPHGDLRSERTGIWLETDEFPVKHRGKLLGRQPAGPDSCPARQPAIAGYLMVTLVREVISFFGSFTRSRP